MPYIWLGIALAMTAVAIGAWLLGFLAGYKAGWLDGLVKR